MILESLIKVFFFVVSSLSDRMNIFIIFYLWISGFFKTLTVNKFDDKHSLITQRFT